MTECLIVFTRTPELGKCKRRLAAGVGDEAALTAHRELATGLLSKVEAFSGLKHLCVTHRSEEVVSWASQFGFELLLQTGGSLGSRMYSALEHALLLGADRAVLVGTDCPDIDLGYVQQAFLTLKESEIVVGPAEDGGYGLIGLAQFLPQIFQEIEWGTARVMEQTLTRAKHLGVSVGQLPQIWDVDTEVDWQRYLANFV